ncbi:DUF4386 domain-containing protein [Chloroflexota bacterium]
MTTSENMNIYRKNAIVVGVLFIIATAFLFIGEAFYGPILNSPDFLEIAYPNRITVIIGILLEFACVIAIPLIPLFMYPSLKKYSEPLALGYVVFRLFEAVFFVANEISKLSLISVSQGYLTSGDAAFFQNLGGAIQSEIVWGFSMYVLIFALGSAMFNSVLCKYKIVPRFISGWGVLAAILIFVGTTLVLFEIATETVAVIFLLPCKKWYLRCG